MRYDFNEAEIKLISTCVIYGLMNISQLTDNDILDCNSIFKKIFNDQPIFTNINTKDYGTIDQWIEAIENNELYSIYTISKLFRELKPYYAEKQKI